MSWPCPACRRAYTCARRRPAAPRQKHQLSQLSDCWPVTHARLLGEHFILPQKGKKRGAQDRRTWEHHSCSEGGPAGRLFSHTHTNCSHAHTCTCTHVALTHVAHRHTHTDTHAHTNCACTHMHTCLLMCTQTGSHTHMYTHSLLMHTQAYIVICTLHMSVYKHRQTHTHIHSHNLLMHTQPYA